MIVTIDGPAGAGKGTITKKVGELLNLINIDTGALFRCVALNLINDNISIEEEPKIKKILENINIELKENDEVYLNNENVTTKIRENNVNNLVSKVAKLPIVRENLLILQRNIAENKNIIIEGRDTGTTVFPEANVKIYLDATAEERAKRRQKQNIEKGINSNYDEVLKEIKERDHDDKTRELSPLKQAPDAIYIDSTNLTIDEVVNKIVNIIKENNS